MYGIYTNIGGILMVNVTIYGIHGSYGVLCQYYFNSISMGKFGKLPHISQNLIAIYVFIYVFIIIYHETAVEELLLHV